MEEIKVFLDADVIISSLLSQKGASFELIKNPKIKKTISYAVEKEINEVSKKIFINSKKRKDILNKVKIITLNQTKKKLFENYSSYVFDEEDSHVIAGAHKSKSNFLLTYNTKHYNSTKIKNYLDIIVMRPGEFLQYLRSRKEKIEIN